MCVCVFVFVMYICVCVCVCIYIYVYVHISIYIVCVCVCINIYFVYICVCRCVGACVSHTLWMVRVVRITHKVHMFECLYTNQFVFKSHVSKYLYTNNMHILHTRKHHPARHTNTSCHTSTCSTLRTISITENLAAPRCNTLPHAATRCNALQHDATRCNTLQHTTNLFRDTQQERSRLPPILPCSQLTPPCHMHERVRDDKSSSRNFLFALPPPLKRCDIRTPCPAPVFCMCVCDCACFCVHRMCLCACVIVFFFPGVCCLA